MVAGAHKLLFHRIGTARQPNCTLTHRSFHLGGDCPLEPSRLAPTAGRGMATFRPILFHIPNKPHPPVIT